MNTRYEPDEIDAVDVWNATRPPGTPVRYWDGSACKWRPAATASEAFLVRGVASVHLEGRKSPISLNHVVLTLEDGAA